MATTLRSDPLRNFKFQVQIIYTTTNIQTKKLTSNLATLGFMSVSGLSMTTEMIPYREGGMNTVTRKMPGQSDFPPVTFQRGLFAGSGELFDWFKDIFFIDDVIGPVGGVKNPDFRATVLIRVLPHPAVHYTGILNIPGGADPVKQHTDVSKQAWRLYNAWPTSMSWSDLDAGGNGIVMEQLTVVHEGLVPAYANSKTASGVANWDGAK